MKKLLLGCFLFSLFSFAFAKDDPRLIHASRRDSAGWICIHLEGKPSEIGYQHGFLLSSEIDEAIRMEKMIMKKKTGRDWNFFRDASKNMFWSKIDLEYRQEMQGIADGLRAKGKKYDIYDIIALNGSIELGSYYVPWLDEKIKPGSSNNKAPGNCSAFAATGTYTSDGKIVIGHNNWSDYLHGERWNVIADIVPTKGNRIFMDIYPGFIHSGDDFAMNTGGILITETTITQFKGFDVQGIPEFVRARKAEQYANSIDDFVRIMTVGDNGGYANDWLVGDIKTNEIARLELGLKNHRVWRTKDGIYVGSNYASDEKLIREETTFNPNDSTNSPNSRKRRWEELTDLYKGKIDASNGKLMEGDTYDDLLKTNAMSRCVIAGRVDTDPKGCPEWEWAPFYPGGTVQGKVTTTDLAKDLQFWAHMGNPDGNDFLVIPFLTAHPQYNWQSPFLRDMKAYPWTLFQAKK